MLIVYIIKCAKLVGDKILWSNLLSKWFCGKFRAFTNISGLTALVCYHLTSVFGNVPSSCGDGWRWGEAGVDKFWQRFPSPPTAISEVGSWNQPPVKTWQTIFSLTWVILVEVAPHDWNQLDSCYSYHFWPFCFFGWVWKMSRKRVPYFLGSLCKIQGGKHEIQKWA